ncbi:MAG: photosynthetic complex assembly protein PuhC [Pseudomonadota bacterium]
MLRMSAAKHDSEARMAQVMKLVAGFLMSFVVVIGLAQFTDRPLSKQPVQGAILQERTIFLSGDISGAAEIRDENGKLIQAFASGDGGFVSTMDRAIRRKRMLDQVDPGGPLLLRRQEGGVISLFDPATGKDIRLRSFGIDNARVFEGLLATS